MAEQKNTSTTSRGEEEIPTYHGVSPITIDDLLEGLDSVSTFPKIDPRERDRAARSGQNSISIIRPNLANVLHEVQTAIDQEASSSGDVDEKIDIDDFSEFMEGIEDPVSNDLGDILDEDELAFYRRGKEIMLMTAEKAREFLTAERTGAEYSDLTAQKGNLIFKLYPGGLVCARYGKNGMIGKPVKLCNPIEPIAYVRLPDDSGGGFMLVRYDGSDNLARERTVPINIGTIDERYFPGLKVAKNDINSVVSALNLFYDQKLNAGTLPCLDAFDKTGWTVGIDATPEELANGDFIKTDDPRFMPPEKLRNVYAKAGTMEAWIEAAHRFMEHSPLATLLGSLAFAAHCRQMVFSTNIQPIVSLFGAPQKGKSTIGAMIASFQGAGTPLAQGTPIIGSSDSLAGIERAIAPANNGLLVLEEADEIIREDPRGATKFFMNMANGGVRYRIVQGKAQTVAACQLTYFSVSNSPLLDTFDHSVIDKDAAIRDRVIEFDIENSEIPHASMTPELAGIEKVFYENYGHTCDWVIQHCKENPEGLREIFQEQFMSLVKGGMSSRQAELAVTFTFGAGLMMIFFEDHGKPLSDETCNRLMTSIEVLKDRLKLQKQEQAEAQTVNAREAIRQFLGNYHNHFIIEAREGVGRGARDVPCYLFRREPSGLASDEATQRNHAILKSNEAREKGNLWGRIEQTVEMKNSTDFSGLVYFHAPVCDYIKKITGTDIRQLSKIAEKQGMEVETKKKKNLWGDDTSAIHNVILFDLRSEVPEDRGAPGPDCPF